MVHPLVTQLRFTRSEFRRAFAGVSNEEARRRFAPINCISWIIGHMAWQEQRYWLFFGQEKMPQPEIQKQFACGAPPSTPGLDEMRSAWNNITESADPWLNELTTEKLQAPVIIDGKTSEYIFGSLVRRVTYHYWFHTGEIMAVRKLLGHTDLPQFVGDIDAEAPYVPE